MQNAWLKVCYDLACPGSQPNMYIMDIEASTELKLPLAKNNIKYKLFLRHIH